MLIKPAFSHTLTQCWYTRIHVPVLHRERGSDGFVTSICRYCERPIRSYGGKSWTLADGVDLDELAALSRTPYICVTSISDGMIIARYPIGDGADEDAVRARLEAVIVEHGAREPGSGLAVRVVGGGPKSFT